MQYRTVSKLAMSLPEAEERPTWETITFRVRNKIFAMFADDRKAIWVKTTRDEQQALIAEDADTFFFPPYVGSSGWVGVRFRTADRDELEELLVEAWRMTAPKRLVRSFDEAGGA
ncbi:MAG: MmcQ/YjbR family DNA-binding protein [Actinomycetota bacterium]